MKQINIHILGLILFIGLAACSEDKEQVSGKGILRVGVQVDKSVLTKADDTSVKLLIVKVDADGNPLEGAPTTEYTVSAGVEKEITLEATTYSITAILGSDPKGKPTSEPYYSGSQLISLTAGETKPVKIECKLTTAVIAVDYTGLGSYVSNGYDFQTVVQLQGSADKIVFGKDETDKNGYFLPTGILSVTFCYGKNNVWQEVAMQSVTNIEAQHKYVIKYSEKENSGDVQQGAAGVGIVVVQPSETGEDVQIGVTLPKLTLAIEPLSDDLLGDVYAGVYGTALMNNGTAVDQLSFVYQELGSSSQEIAAESKNNKWYAKLEGLKPATRYKVWVKDHADIYQEFTTKSVTKPANAWAKFAYLSATYSLNPSPNDVKFQYKQLSAPGWSEVESVTKNQNGEYSCKLTGLTSNTEYQYRFVSGSLEGNVETFTTEEERVLPNGNFDIWSKNGDIWFAGTQEEANAKNAFWDSGNVGASTLKVNPTQGDDSQVHTSGGQSAYLYSQFVSFLGIGKFAAGNLYSGQYQQTYTSGSMGARIRMGRPFTSRPIQLKGWYNYIPQKINYTGGTHKMTNNMDQCAIYIALTDVPSCVDFEGNLVSTSPVGDKTTAFEINTQENQYVTMNMDNPHILAYGTITPAESNVTGGWKPFVIDLVYKDLVRKPTFIVIVSSASKDGDYFTGAGYYKPLFSSAEPGSILYLDDFELIYGDNPITQ